jgi:hypothetical protein
MEITVCRPKTLPLDSGRRTWAVSESHSAVSDEESGDYRGDPPQDSNPGIGDGRLPSMAPYSRNIGESPMSFWPSGTNYFSIQGQHTASCQIPKHQLHEFAANAKAVGVVNVLGCGNSEVSICRDFFGTSLTTGSNNPPKWRLVQMLCCVDTNDQPFWDASKPVSGDAIKAILSNSSSVPLILTMPLNETNNTTSDHPAWVNELQDILSASSISSRHPEQNQHRAPIVVIGTCSDVHLSNIDNLQRFVSTELSISNVRCLTPLSSGYQKATQTIVDFICSLKSPSPEVAKLVFRKRCEGTETMSWSEIEDIVRVESPSSNEDFISTVLEYLEKTGLVLSFSPSLRTGNVRNADVSANHKRLGSTSEDELLLVLQPDTFENSVVKLMNKCKAAHEDINEFLIAAACQHGLVPRDAIDSIASSLDHAVLSVLHRSGILVDPQQVTCLNSSCTDKIYVTDSNMNLLSVDATSVRKNARLCLFVPSLAAEGPRAGLESMTGYISTSSLLFRQEGPYFRGIPLSLFYILLTSLMKRFPYFVKFWRYSGRFHVDPQHILHVEYLQHSIKLVMHVQTKDPMFLQVTGNVCNSIREMVSSQLYVLRQSVGTVADLQLQPAAFVAGGELDFVDVRNINPLTTDVQLYSISGNDFCLEDNFYLWYGRLGKGPSGIQEKFASLSNHIKPLLTAAWLYEKELLHHSEMDRILDVDQDARCQLLLRILETKGTKGEEILSEILQQSRLKTMNTKDTATQTTQGQDEKIAYESSIQPSIHHVRDKHPNSRQQPLRDNAEKQYRPVVVTSTSNTRSGLQEQELVFPRTQPPSLHSPTPTNMDPPLLPQTNLPHTKGDPEIKPIFESKYWHVERATNHFNEARLKDGGKRLGSGSFSTVFHGVLHSESGQSFEVAVKRLKKASSLSSVQAELGKKQFSIEMSVLTRYIHKNVVRLLGFSSDGPDLCLIYEYLQKGALSHRLDCQVCSINI